MSDELRKNCAKDEIHFTEQGLALGGNEYEKNDGFTDGNDDFTDCM